MPEPFTLTALLIAGANLVGTETVKEVTKDAYRKLKEKVGQVFGPRAATAVAKLENPATHEEGHKDLERYVGDDLRPDEATELAPLEVALTTRRNMILPSNTTGIRNHNVRKNDEKPVPTNWQKSLLGSSNFGRSP